MTIWGEVDLFTAGVLILFFQLKKSPWTKQSCKQDYITFLLSCVLVCSHPCSTSIASATCTSFCFSSLSSCVLTFCSFAYLSSCPLRICSSSKIVIGSLRISYQNEKLLSPLEADILKFLLQRIKKQVLQGVLQFPISYLLKCICLCFYHQLGRICTVTVYQKNVHHSVVSHCLLSLQLSAA